MAGGVGPPELFLGELGDAGREAEADEVEQGEGGQGLAVAVGGVLDDGSSVVFPRISSRVSLEEVSWSTVITSFWYAQEAFLVGADLVDEDLVAAGVWIDLPLPATTHTAACGCTTCGFRR